MGSLGIRTTFAIYSSELGLNRMLRQVVKVDKLCSLRFITLIKVYDCNSSDYYDKGSSFITSEGRGFERSVVFRTKSCKSCKIRDLAIDFRA